MAERARGLPLAQRAVCRSAPRAQREGLPLLEERAGGEVFHWVSSLLFAMVFKDVFFRR